MIAEKVLITRTPAGFLKRCELLDAGGNVICELPLASLRFEQDAAHDRGQVHLGLQGTRVVFA